MYSKLSLIPAVLISLFIGWNVNTIYNDLKTQVITEKEAVTSEEDWGHIIVYTDDTTTDTFGTTNMLTAAAELRPGEQIHPPHQHAAEEFMYVVSGEGTWSVNGQEFRAQKGDVMYAQPWDWHGIKNTGDEPLVFFVMKWDNKGVPAPPRKE